MPRRRTLPSGSSASPAPASGPLTRSGSCVLCSDRLAGEAREGREEGRGTSAQPPTLGWGESGCHLRDCVCIRHVLSRSQPAAEP